MIPPDLIVIVDWSGGNDRGPTPKRDAIWIGTPDSATYCRSRQVAETAITAQIDSALADGATILVGFDFPFACPAGFARAITGQDSAFALWDWVADRLSDTPKVNNRVAVAGEMNRLAGGIGPFWGNGLLQDHPHVPRKGNNRTHRWPVPRRVTEQAAKGAFECWQLFGAGAVGSQMLTGMPVLARLRHRYGPALRVWPFEPCADARVVLAEVFPTVIDAAVRTVTIRDAAIRDAVQVRLLAAALAGLGPDDWDQLSQIHAPEEGWILGAGPLAHRLHHLALARACV